MDNQGPIVFYDGNCGLCDASVRWILDHDRRKRFRFAPLQGTTYASLDIDNKPTDLSSMILWDNNTLWTQSSAVIRVLWGLQGFGGVWGLLGCLGWCIPKLIRDWGYRYVAARRLRWFGGAERCRLPKPGENARLLP